MPEEEELTEPVEGPTNDPAVAEEPPVEAPVEEVAVEEGLPDDISALVQSLDADTDMRAEATTASWGELGAIAGSAAEPGTVPTWPFIVYIAVWVVFAALGVWQFSQVPSGQAVYESPLYPVSLLVGIAMLVAGPLLVLAVWLVSATRSVPGARGRALLSSLIKGAVATFGGAVLWWAMLMIVDAVRLGRPF
jgi:hypothetical protein